MHGRTVGWEHFFLDGVLCVFFIFVSCGFLLTRRPPPPSEHLRLFWREEKPQVFFAATTEQNIARVNLFHKLSVSFYLMAATRSLPFIGNVLFL
jgi:hypothetical protein